MPLLLLLLLLLLLFIPKDTEEPNLPRRSALGLSSVIASFFFLPFLLCLRLYDLSHKSKRVVDDVTDAAVFAAAAAVDCAVDSDVD